MLAISLVSGVNQKGGEYIYEHWMKMIYWKGKFANTDQGIDNPDECAEIYQKER